MTHRILIVALLLLTLSQCLSYRSQKHLDDTDDYYKALIKEQKELSEALNKILDRADALSATVDEIAQNEKEQVITYQQGVEKEREILEGISTNMSIPFDLKTFDCTDVEPQSLQAINDQIQDMEEQLTDLEEKISNLEETAGDSYPILYSQYEQTVKQLTKLKKTEESACPQSLMNKQAEKSNTTNEQLFPANMQGALFYTNNNAQKWTLGDLTEKQYALKMFAKSSKNNVTKCPYDKPFYFESKDQCDTCPQQTPIFDISKDQCIKCQDKQVFDPVDKKCIVHDCSNGQQFDFKTKTCKCPAQAPYFTETECISCYIPNYFNIDSKKCEKCDENKTINADSNGCTDCQPTKPISDGYTCKSPCDPVTNKVWDPSKKKCVCPRFKNYFDGTKCISCFLPKYFNTKQKACVYCPEGQYFQVLKRKCVPCPEGTKYDKDKLKCSCLKQGQYLDERTKICHCPKFAPFFDEEKCLGCFLPKYWEKAEKKCKDCQFGTYFDLRQKKCVPCLENRPRWEAGRCYPCRSGQTYNKDDNTCEKNEHHHQHKASTNKFSLGNCENHQIFDIKTKACVCPHFAPYSTNQSCISCLPPKRWNQATQVCSYCPIGQKFDANEGKCVHRTEPANPSLQQNHIDELTNKWYSQIFN